MNVIPLIADNLEIAYTKKTFMRQDDIVNRKMLGRAYITINVDFFGSKKHFFVDFILSANNNVSRIKTLVDKISELLGVNEGYRAVIVGAGNLGHALAATHMFERRGVKRVAMFDTKAELIGTKICGLPVYSVDELYDFCKREAIAIGVLTLPKEAAYDVSMKMVEAGVKGLWNFANMELKIPDPTVIVENIHLGDSLMKLCYEIKTGNGDYDYD